MSAVVSTTPPFAFPNIHTFTSAFPLHASFRAQLRDWATITATTTNLNRPLVSFLLAGEEGSGKTTLLVDFICQYYPISESAVSAYFASDTDPQFNLLFFHSYKSQCIADIRDQLNAFCPIRCSFPNRKKIVVVDDADTLPDPMQQLLCGYMDKYEHSVLFVGTCTCPQKLNDRFQSRFIQLQVPTISSATMHEYIQWEAERHHLCLEPDALSFLQRVCTNHLKKTQQQLHKLALYLCPATSPPAPLLSVSRDTLCAVCSFISPDTWNQILTHAHKQDESWTLSAVQLMALIDAGHSLPDIYTSFVDFIIYIFQFTTNKTQPVPQSDSNGIVVLSSAQRYECIKIACHHMSIYYRVTETETQLLLFANDLHNLFVHSKGISSSWSVPVSSPAIAI